MTDNRIRKSGVSTPPYLCPDGSNPCGRYGYCGHCPHDKSKRMQAMTTNKPEAAQMVGDAKYDTALFCDLKTDEEKSTFFLSGRGYETGVIAQAIQNDVAMAYHRCSEYRKELEALQAECEKLRKDAERYRWLRDGASMLTDLNPWEDVGFVGAVCVCTEYGSQTALTDEDLDAAIDAAMEPPK